MGFDTEGRHQPSITWKSILPIVHFATKFCRARHRHGFSTYKPITYFQKGAWPSQTNLDLGSPQGGNEQGETQQLKLFDREHASCNPGFCARSSQEVGVFLNCCGVGFDERVFLRKASIFIR